MSKSQDDSVRGQAAAASPALPTHASLTQPTPTVAGSPLLEVRGVDKRYGGVHALKSVSLDVVPGEILGLVGENGAGKSTLIRVLSGSTSRDEGSILVDGRETEIADERAAESLGFHFLHQNLAMVDRLSVAENLFLGKHLAKTGPLVSRKKTVASARAALAGFSTVDPRVPFGSLSLAAQWMVAISRVCLGDARLVVMDEPTVALSDAEVETLLRTIQDLKSRGVAVVFVSHRLTEVLRICDRVAVMKDGQCLGTHEVTGLDQPALVSLILGEETAQRIHEFEQEAPPAAGAVVLSVRELSGGPLRRVDLDAHAGEILGVAGLAGAGRSSLLQQIVGSHRPSSGSVRLNGTVITGRSTTATMKLGLALVPEDRHLDAMLARRSVRENAVLSSLQKHRVSRRVPIPRRRSEREATQASIRKMDIRSHSTQQVVGSLSGGNQQKVVIARALMRDGLRVLLLDEPTKGVDVGAKFEIYQILRQLAAEGAAVIVVSSDLEEIVALAHRAVVLKEGLVSGVVEAPMTDAELLALCF